MFNAHNQWIGRAGALGVIAGTALVTGIAAAGVAGAGTPLTPVVQDTATTSTSTGSGDPQPLVDVLVGGSAGIVTYSSDVPGALVTIAQFLSAGSANDLGTPNGVSGCRYGVDGPMCGSPTMSS